MSYLDKRPERRTVGPLEWARQQRDAEVWRAVAAGIRDGQRAHLDTYRPTTGRYSANGG